MPPETLQLALFAIEEGIKLEPGIAAAIRSMFAQGDPTPADWNALRAKVAAKKYSDYVPASALTPATPVTIVQLPTAPATAPAPQLFTGQAADPHAAT
jgi:hypothetical protein